MDLYLPVLLGTVREGRQSEDVARYVVQRIARQPGVRTRLVDPRDLPFGNLVRREWEMDPQPPEVAAFVADMARADGFVVVVPEYNYGIPGALKNLLDHLYDEWNRKPFGAVGCGGMSGGLRAVDHLRHVVSGLGAVMVPAHLPVPFTPRAFDAEGPTSERERWDARIDKFVGEVVWYARALQAARAGAAAPREGEGLSPAPSVVR